MFHARDGLYFGRLEDGSVKVRVEAINGMTFETLLGPDTWASVMSQASARGETLDTWNEAKQFHER